MTIPIAAPVVSERAKTAVESVLDSGMIADGEHVRQFEEAFADYVGVEHAVATSSGTTALHAMLEAAGIGDGDVVVTTPFSFISSANAIKHAGAEPIFADIDLSTYNLDPRQTRALLEQREDISAIMPVHLYGLPAKMDRFRELAAEFDVQLFEDAAQAHGATQDGSMVGSLCDAAAFSFYPSKNMTTGEGGMITTDKEELAERARQVTDHGRSGSYEHEFVGYNYRMTNMQAVIGLEQLERLPGWIDQRRENARQLTSALDEFPGLVTPMAPSDCSHAFHQYTVRCKDRAALKSALDAHDVGYGTYYSKTIPYQPAYDRDVAVPAASHTASTVLSLPVHPQVDDDDIKTIVRAVRAGVETQ